MLQGGYMGLTVGLRQGRRTEFRTLQNSHLDWTRTSILPAYPAPVLNRMSNLVLPCTRYS